MKTVKPNSKKIQSSRSESKSRPIKKVVSTSQKKKKVELKKIKEKNDKNSNDTNENDTNSKLKKKLNSSSSTVKTASNASNISQSKNIDTIGRLINKSSDIIAEQNSLLDKYQELAKKFTSSDYEIERLLGKNEYDEFQKFFDKYGGKLNHMMQRLKIHTEEMEEIKYVKEENKNLKYQYELSSIDKSDLGIQFESKYNSIKSFLICEFNNFNEFISDNGYEHLFHTFQNSNFSEENLSIYLQNIKKLIRNFKFTHIENQKEKDVLKDDRKKLQNDLIDLKKKFDDYKRSNSDIEKELIYYKNLARDYQQQMEDLRKINYHQQNEDLRILNVNSNKNVHNSQHNVNLNKDKNQISNNMDVDRERDRDRNRNRYRDRDRDNNKNIINTSEKEYTKNLRSEENNSFLNNEYNPNNSLDNFRRNKDLRILSSSNNTSLLFTNTNPNEENLKLENRYSDSCFYSSKNDNNYNPTDYQPYPQYTSYSETNFSPDYLPNNYK